MAAPTAIAAALVASCTASPPPPVAPPPPVGGGAPTAAQAPRQASGGSGETSPEASPKRPSARDAARLEALYLERADRAKSEPHPADARFMEDMIAHHAQALTMTSFAPAAGASESIRTLCARIFASQRDEIQLMGRWLEDRGLDAPAVDLETGRMETGHHHGGHGAGHAPRAPGMLSEAQLDELARAKGGDFDRLLLEHMIMHHEGAVTMVEDLFAAAGAALDHAVFRLASDIQVDQRSEIKRMRLMLEAL